MNRRLSSWHERVPRWRKVVAVLLGLVAVAAAVLVVRLRAPLLVLVAMAIGVLAAALVTTASRPRPVRQHEALGAWASERGWSYTRVDSGLVAVWSGAPFDHGSAHTTREVLRGGWDGRGVVSCTVRWNEPTGALSGTTRHYGHLVAVMLPWLLPDLHVSPHVDDSARERHAQDVVTESVAFNAEWRVRGSDLRTVHGVLHPATMERLMLPDVRGAHLRTEGAWLLLWWPGPTVLDLLAGRIAAATDLARRIPRHVWQDHGYDPRTAGPSEELW
ncbi:MAG TPA: hypothetical protein VGC57_13665 [Cellulomonas sp.]